MEIEEIKKENEQLKKLNAVKSDLISISAHQLRTSLSALKWILKMFLDKDVGEMSTEQEGFVKKAYDSNERMIALVNDMLTLNHTEDTALTFNFKNLDIVKLIDETLFEFSGESHKKGIELIFLKGEDNIPLIKCDEAMMRVVMQNLIENSIKYSNTGGKVFISIKLNSESVEISVKDNGIGIKDEDKDKIFGKFFRSTDAIAKDPVGSGLGLFTTKNIVEHHNGKIWFESETGKGTAFLVALPIK